MIATLTQSQSVLLILFAFAALAWTTFWLSVWYMAFRVLRWTYLEKKAAGQAPKMWVTPRSLVP